jgi:hypothetical protein
MLTLAHFAFRFRLWRRETVDRWRWKLAWMVPRSIAILVFVRVYSATSDAPGPDYIRAYRAWDAGAGR